MMDFITKYKIVLIIVVTSFFPVGAFAQSNNQTCSSVGYTIATINGVFTDLDGAIANSDALRRKLQPVLHGTYNNEPLTVDFLFNPSHAVGAGDVLKSIQQGLFDDETIRDTDLLSMLTDASRQVKTQKILLVPHSQGNFYANAIRKALADKLGGVEAKSIGIFGVANPASHMYNGGAWLTSDTDKVISGAVGHVPFRTILPTNISIPFKDSDGDFFGHDFTKIYLKYATPEIVLGIQSSLSKLQADPGRRDDIPCIAPPELTAVDKVSNATFAVADVALIAATTDVNDISSLDFWLSYATKIMIAKNMVIDATYAVGATLHSMSTLSSRGGGDFTSNNTASVILATQNTDTVSPVKISPPVTPQTLQTKLIPPLLVVPSPAKHAVIIQPTPTPNPSLVLKVIATQNQTSTNVPHLVFVGNLLGGSSGGGSPPPQVLGYTMGVTAGAVETETATTTTEVLADMAGAALAPPALATHQCTASLAIDGCLLATTIVHFSWAPVTGADHYAISKNGVSATTTATELDVTVKDFSDYILQVRAVDNLGIASATSTQTVSVATIPIAINEIAWMGTVASSTAEWMELKNNTSHTIDLSQWVLAAKDGIPYIKLTKTIAPREYILLERAKDTNVVDVVAHQTYSGALENTGEQLSLSRASIIFDQTPSGVWVAGYNSTTTKKTMERYSSREPGINPGNWATWGTNGMDFIKNGTDNASSTISGTPGAQNSVSYLINKGRDVTKDVTLTADNVYVISTSTTVTASSTLFVEPGVDIKFYEGSTWIDTKFVGDTIVWGKWSSPAELNIKGTLSVKGTKDNPVTFESLSDSTTGTLRFEGGIATSTIENARIKNTQGVVLDEGARLQIQGTDFTSNYKGVELSGSSTVSLQDVHFASTTKKAIAAYEGSFVSLASSTVMNTLDSDAIAIESGSFLKMSSTTIDGVQDGDGIYVDRSTASVKNSTIKNISNSSGSAVDSFGSIISLASTTISGVHGDGIDLVSSTSTISNTVVDGGGTGRNGISVSLGAAEIASTTVTGFASYGSGVAVFSDYAPRTRDTLPIVSITGNSEIFGNGFGVGSPLGTVVVSGDTSIHDNVAANTITWGPSGEQVN
jgi:hypothetical protein